MVCEEKGRKEGCDDEREGSVDESTARSREEVERLSKLVKLIDHYFGRESACRREEEQENEMKNVGRSE